MAKLDAPLTPAAQSLYHQLQAERGNQPLAMYHAMLHNPEVTEKVSALGSYLRFHGQIAADLREAVILYVARKLNCHYEWEKHEPDARKAGLDDQLIAEIKNGGDMPLTTKKFGAAFKVVDKVFQGLSIPAPLQNTVVKNLGSNVLVELVILVGFYKMIAGMISAFDIENT